MEQLTAYTEEKCPFIPVIYYEDNIIGSFVCYLYSEYEKKKAIDMIRYFSFEWLKSDLLADEIFAQENQEQSPNSILILYENENVIWEKKMFTKRDVIGLLEDINMLTQLHNEY